MLLFAVSWSVGAWVLISEVFPEKIKGFGMGLAVSLMWIANFLISLLFPVINDNAGCRRPSAALSRCGFLSSLIWSAMSLFLVMCRKQRVPLTEIERLAENKLREIQGNVAM